jgi:hypothetical protein
VKERLRRALVVLLTIALLSNSMATCMPALANELTKEETSSVPARAASTPLGPSSDAMTSSEPETSDVPATQPSTETDVAPETADTTKAVDGPETSDASDDEPTSTIATTEAASTGACATTLDAEGALSAMSNSAVAKIVSGDSVQTFDTLTDAVAAANASATDVTIELLEPSYDLSTSLALSCTNPINVTITTAKTASEGCTDDHPYLGESGVPAVLRRTAGGADSTRLLNMGGTGGFTCTLRNVTLDGNRSELGEKAGHEAVYVTGSANSLVLGDGATVQNSSAADNDGDDAGGIYVNASNLTLLSGCAITNCSGYYAGGIEAWNGSKVDISGGDFSGNTSNCSGTGHPSCGFLSAQTNCTVTMSGGTIHGNTGYLCGALQGWGNCAIEMSGGTITDNLATGMTWSSGGIYATGTDDVASVTGGSIVGNGTMAKIETYLGCVGGAMSADGSIRISGNPVITGNYSDAARVGDAVTGSQTCNIANKNGKSVSVTGKLTGDTRSIGICSYPPSGSASGSVDGVTFATLRAAAETTGIHTAADDEFAVFSNDNTADLAWSDGGKLVCTSKEGDANLSWGPLPNFKIVQGGTTTTYQRLSDAIKAANASASDVTIEQLAATYDVSELETVDPTNKISVTITTATSDATDGFAYRGTAGTTAVLRRSSSLTGSPLFKAGPNSKGEPLRFSNVTIDGAGIDASWALVYVSGGSAVLESGATVRNGLDQNAGGQNTSGGIDVRDGGTLECLDGCCITSCKAYRCGAVYCSGSGTTVTLVGGDFSGNSTTRLSTDQATYSSAGFAAVEGSAKFIQHGGSITGNTGVAAGAVQLFGGSFVMDGGTIGSNLASSQSNWSAGAIYATSTSDSIVITGGTITGNGTASPVNGYLGSSSGAIAGHSSGFPISISGNPVITGNWCGAERLNDGSIGGTTAANIALPNGRTINVPAPLTGAKGSIGVRSYPTTSASPWPCDRVKFATLATAATSTVPHTASDDSLAVFSCDNTVGLSDEETLAGWTVSGDASMRWGTMPNFKIDHDGQVDLFDHLSDAVTAAKTFTTDVTIEELTPSYDVTEQQIITCASATKITFTTAGKDSSDGWSYRGAEGTPAVLRRTAKSGNSGRILLIQAGTAGNTTCVLTNITLDGNRDATTPASCVELVYVTNGNHLVVGDGATLRDSSSWNGYDPSGAIYVNEGTVRLLEGSAIKNCSGYYAGGIYAYGSKTEVSIEGGDFSENSCTATNPSAGFAFIDGSSRIDMSGGSIHGNTGVEAGAIELWNPGLFSMSGGSISGNLATSSSWSAGGVYATYGGSTIELSGGSITGNGTAASVGGSLGSTAGGIAGNGSGFPLSVSGSPVVMDNWCGATRSSDGTITGTDKADVTLPNGHPINITASLTGAKGSIGIRSYPSDSAAGGPVQGVQFGTLPASEGSTGVHLEDSLAVFACDNDAELAPWTEAGTTVLRWGVDEPICKIVHHDAQGEVSSVETYDSLFGYSLANGVSRSGAIDAANASTTDVTIQMLAPIHEVTKKGTINPTTPGIKVSLTTAASEDGLEQGDIWAYRGTSGTPAVVRRAATFTSDSFSLISSGCELDLSDITLDGGSEAITSRLGVLFIDNVGGTLRLGSGATIQHASTSSAAEWAVGNAYNSSIYGSAVRNQSGATMYMEKGSMVRDCKSMDGGVIFLNGAGVSLVMNGGTIEGCCTTRASEYNSTIQLDNGASFVMHDGLITNNEATGASSTGSAVQVRVSSSMTMDGGTITSNYSGGTTHQAANGSGTESVGGVTVDGSSTLTLSGSSTITGNYGSCTFTDGVVNLGEDGTPVGGVVGNVSCWKKERVRIAGDLTGKVGITSFAGMREGDAFAITTVDDSSSVSGLSNIVCDCNVDNYRACPVGAAGTGSSVVWLALPVAKIVHEDGAVATYGTLDSAIVAANGSGTDTVIQMLVPNYDMVVGSKVSSTHALTVTTAKTSSEGCDDGHPYEGVSGVPATLRRVTSYTGAFFTQTAKNSLTLEDITLDGNKSVVPAGTAAAVGFSSANATFTLGDGATIKDFSNDLTRTIWGVAIDATTGVSGETVNLLPGCAITGCTGYYCGAVSIDNGTLNISGGRFAGNRAMSTSTSNTTAGFARIIFSSKLNVSGGTFESNRGYVSGCFETWANTTVSISDGIFRNNFASSTWISAGVLAPNYNGGYWDSASTSISGGLFDGNGTSAKLADNRGWIGGAISGYGNLTISGAPIIASGIDLGQGVVTQGNWTASSVSGEGADQVVSHDASSVEANVVEESRSYFLKVHDLTGPMRSVGFWTYPSDGTVTGSVSGLRFGTTVSGTGSEITNQTSTYDAAYASLRCDNDTTLRPMTVSGTSQLVWAEPEYSYLKLAVSLDGAAGEGGADVQFEIARSGDSASFSYYQSVHINAGETSGSVIVRLPCDTYDISEVDAGWRRTACGAGFDGVAGSSDSSLEGCVMTTPGTLANGLGSHVASFSNASTNTCWESDHVYVGNTVE